MRFPSTIFDRRLTLYSSLNHGRHNDSSSSGTATPYPQSGTLTPESEDALKIPASDSLAVSISEKIQRRESFQKARLAAPKIDHLPSTGMTKEHVERGRVKTEVYKQYIKASSKLGFSLFLLGTILQQVASILSTFALRYWGEHNRERGDNEGMSKYLALYGGLSLSSTLFGCLSSVLMWVFCSLRSSKYLHDAVSLLLGNQKVNLYCIRCSTPCFALR